MLPQDGHVHSQFSWDAIAGGDMHATCARAVAIGLRSLAFTEHVDLTPWALHGRDLPAHYTGRVDEHGRFLAQPLAIAAYLEEVDRCRRAFPALRILSGVELSEPHRHPGAVPGLLAAAGLAGTGGLDRVIGSVHALDDVPTGGRHTDAAGFVEVVDGYLQRAPVDVVVAYLEEVTALAGSDADFAVLGHIDYPLRSWPEAAGPVPWPALEEAFRVALGALASSGRALEVNTRLPLSPRVVTWWHEAGGQAVVFGSDAHRPDDLAHDFVETAAMVQAHGFRPGAVPHEFWGRA
ncbi:histidinol-phosphatase (PHP family) [Blastococcus aurantiacus]|uniref:Histidinol-phosphatase n=1 Tax=Blastococcus aurantiacus TaxID=1550231 RepID=A0A1G7I3K6_9ACTN|nr:histidinol-phosphatase (PHP family) [Blastococcus aurantiacus]